MNVGDKIKFQFGGKDKEGVVAKIFPKKVYLKVDFPKHPGKLVIRSLAELEGKVPAKKKVEKKKAAKKKVIAKPKAEKAAEKES